MTLTTARATASELADMTDGTHAGNDHNVDGAYAPTSLSILSNGGMAMSSMESALNSISRDQRGNLQPGVRASLSAWSPQFIGQLGKAYLHRQCHIAGTIEVGRFVSLEGHDKDVDLWKANLRDVLLELVNKASCGNHSFFLVNNRTSVLNSPSGTLEPDR
jgi:hypothetical protein